MGSDLFEEDLRAWRSDGNFSAAFKAKVALEALRGDQTLAGRHKVPPNLITKWKRQGAAGMVDVFSGQKGARDGSHEVEIKELHAKIGELTVEKDAARAYAAPLPPRSCSLSKAFGR